LLTFVFHTVKIERAKLNDCLKLNKRLINFFIFCQLNDNYFAALANALNVYSVAQAQHTTNRSSNIKKIV